MSRAVQGVRLSARPFPGTKLELAPTSNYLKIHILTIPDSDTSLLPQDQYQYLATYDRCNVSDGMARDTPSELCRLLSRSICLGLFISNVVHNRSPRTQAMQVER